MRKKLIKKAISEIVVIILLVLCFVIYVGSEIYLNSNKIYEGQYALQHKNGGRIIEVEYYKDLHEIEGIEKFAGEEVSTRNWYLINVFISSTKHKTFDYENVLISADGKYDCSYKLTIKDGVATIGKNNGQTYSQIEGLRASGYTCDFELNFTGNGLVLKTYRSSELMHHYMEKIGMMPYYNAQIIQIGSAIASSVLLAMYLLVAISKNGKKRPIVVASCALVMFAVVLISGRTTICGEYVNEDADRYLVIRSDEKDKYKVIEGNKINANTYHLDRCTWNNKLLDESNHAVAEKIGAHTVKYGHEVYSSITHIPANEYIAFAYPALSLVGCVLGFAFKIKKKKNPDMKIKLEEMPYCSTYEVVEPVFLCDSLKGMENYFGVNVKGEEVVILPERFYFMGDEVINPQYNMTQCKKKIYPEANVFKGYYVSIADSDYEIYFNYKKTYLAKYMNGSLMVMYQLKRMEA